MAQNNLTPGSGTHPLAEGLHERLRLLVLRVDLLALLGRRHVWVALDRLDLVSDAGNALRYRIGCARLAELFLLRRAVGIRLVVLTTRLVLAQRGERGPVLLEVIVEVAHRLRV